MRLPLPLIVCCGVGLRLTCLLVTGVGGLGFLLVIFESGSSGLAFGLRTCLRGGFSGMGGGLQLLLQQMLPPSTHGFNDDMKRHCSFDKGDAVMTQGSSPTIWPEYHRESGAGSGGVGEGL